MEDVVPTTLCRATEQPNKGQSFYSAALVRRLGLSISEEEELDNVVVGKDDVIPLSSPHLMLTRGSNEDDMTIHKRKRMISW